MSAHSPSDVAAERWRALVAPYAAAAEALGFAFVERLIMAPLAGVTTSVHACNDVHWRGADGTFLDLSGNVTLGPPERGFPEGFLGAAFRTYIRRAGHLDVIWSAAVPEPAPAAPGLVPWFAQRVVGPFFERLTAARHRPIRLARPEDLAVASHRHVELVRGSAGEVLRPSGHLLEQRWAWEAEMENRVAPGDGPTQPTY
ncbi:MAG TPA: hypothetical protein VNA89_09150 [Gemmatimonadaceae bacterium]|nr:hypothetical protein [Gemmatimonadaceae bacterium]